MLPAHVIVHNKHFSAILRFRLMMILFSIITMINVIHFASSVLT